MDLLEGSPEVCKGSLSFWDEVDCLSLVLRLTGAWSKIQMLQMMVTERGQPRKVSQARCDAQTYILQNRLDFITAVPSNVRS